MLRSFERGDAAKARAIHLAVFPLIKALFVETNPGPIKRALYRRGVIAEELRLPLVPVSDRTAADLERVLDQTERSLAGLGIE